MRIGIYNPYLDDLGGGEKYMLKIAECLSEAHEVTFFWDNKEDFEPVLRRFAIDLSRIKISENIFSERVGFLKRLIETMKYDMIIVLSDGSVPTVLSKKLFLHIQQPIPHVSRKGIKGIIKNLMITKIFCNSFYTKNFVERELSSKSVVIYPPVELHPKKIKKENIVLHVGRFRVRDVTSVIKGEKKGVGDYKKQGIMVEAFKEIEKEMPGWKFVLAVSVREGEKEEFEKLKKSAHKANIDFLVNKTNEELWDIYSKAKIYWHASGYGEDLERNPELAEHFGISTVEAMGAGAVPIVISAGGQKEIVQEGETGFLWDTTEELKSKTIKLSKDEVLLNKLSEGAKERAKFFAGDRFCREIKNLVE